MVGVVSGMAVVLVNVVPVTRWMGCLDVGAVEIMWWSDVDGETGQLQSHDV